MPKKQPQMQKQFLHIMLLGDAKAGKTSFCERVVYNPKTFQLDYMATQGIELLSKDICSDNCHIKIIFYDSKGLDKAKDSDDFANAVEFSKKDNFKKNDFEMTFESSKKTFAKQMDGLILLVSPTAEEIAQDFPANFIARAKQNIQAYRSWCEEAGVPKTIPIIVAIGKSDLIAAEHRQKTKEGIGQESIFISALEGEGLIRQASQTDEGLYEYINGLAEVKRQGKAIKKLIPKKTSRRSVTGALWGLVFGAFFAVMVYNPLACMYYQISLDRWREKRLWNIPWLIAAPFLYPIGGIGHQLYHQIRKGWKEGFTAEFKASFSMFADRKIDDDFAIPVRALVVSLLVAALIAGAIICVLFPPAIVAPVLPMLLSTVGLTGFGPWGLSIIIGSAIALAVSLPFLLGDTVYRALYPEFLPKVEPEREYHFESINTYSSAMREINKNPSTQSDKADGEMPGTYPPVLGSEKVVADRLPTVKQAVLNLQPVL